MRSVNVRHCLLLSLILAVSLLSHVTGEEARIEECSGQGKLHGNHCHCNPGFKSKGAECIAINANNGDSSDNKVSAPKSCPAGGIEWELSGALYLEKGSYSLELTNNTKSMATMILPLSSASLPSSQNSSGLSTAELEISIEKANLLLEEVAMPRKALKNGETFIPSEKILYILLRNNDEEMQRQKEECLKAPGNTWHIDHCDGAGGHEGRRRRYRAVQEELSGTSRYNLTVAQSAFYAIHMQHNAMEEFSMRLFQGQSDSRTAMDFLVSIAPEEETGDAPQATEAPAQQKEAKKATPSVWGKTMGAVGIVTLLSVLGILLMAIKSTILDKIMDPLISLSSGALFGAAFLHILPESIEFYSPYGQMEMTLCLVFAAGFLLAMIVEMALELWMAKYEIRNGKDTGATITEERSPAPLPHNTTTYFLPSPSAFSATADEKKPSTASVKTIDEEEELSANVSPLAPISRTLRKSAGSATCNDTVIVSSSADKMAPEDVGYYRHVGSTGASKITSKWAALLMVDWRKIKPMAYIILLGDLFHNFVDGVLIATAFLACDDSLGIAVTVSAILHEIPQEFADFIILLDAGFTVSQAIFFNFLSALSAFVGAAIILGSVKVDNNTMGLLLGFGAGTLVYIAATDLLPRVLRVKSFGQLFMRLFLFILGITALGLTSLYHVHCTEEL